MQALLRKVSGALFLALWCLLAVAVGFVAFYPVQPALEANLKHLAQEAGVAVEMAPGAYRFPLGTRLELESLSYPEERPVIEVNLDQVTAVELRLLPLAFSQTIRGTLEAFGGALAISIAEAHESAFDALVSLRSLPLDAFTGSFTAFATPRGTLNGEVRADLRDFANLGGEIIAALAVEGSITGPPLFAEPLELRNVALNARLSIADNTATLARASIQSDLAEASATGAFSLDPRGSGSIQVDVTLKPGVSARFPELAVFADQFMTGPDTMAVVLRQRAGRWRISDE